MKNIFYVFCFVFLTVSLYASSLESSIDLYDKKEYQKSYLEVKKYLKHNPMDVKANILLANCAYALGYFEEAIIVYDRVIIIEPDNYDAKIQEAKIYLKTGNYGIAKVELDILLQSDLSKEQRQRVLNLKKNLKKSKKSFKGRVTTGIMSFSNSNSDIGSQSHNVPVYNINYKGNNKKRDEAYYIKFDIFSDSKIKDDFGVISRFDAYNRTYFSENQNDLSIFNLILSPYYAQKDFTVFFPLMFNKVFLEHDSYLNRFGAGIDLDVPFDKGRFEVGYKFLKNEYYGKKEDRDSNCHQVYAGIQKLLYKDTLGFAYFKYAKNREIEDLRTDINYDSYNFKTGINKQVYSNLLLRTAFIYTKNSYKDFNRVLLNKREDDIYDYLLGVTYDINKASSVKLDLNYLNKKSNQFLYDYDDLIFNLGYIYKF